MPAQSHLRIVLLLCIAPLLSACSAQQPRPVAPAAQTGRERVSEPAASAPRQLAPAAAAATGGKPALALSSAQGRPGEVVTISATLTTAGDSIAGTQNDITFDPSQISVVAKANGRPDCTPNRQLGKEGTAFSFLPPRCQKPACTGVRALVLSLSNVAPIPSGSVLYTCRVAIASQATAGAHPLSVTHAGFSNPTGQAIQAASVDGAVTVGK
jgi:hypothetical protein